ncbi:T7SS effector LXG polymorphic toxin [Pseudalkalibacillus decolorationis]|uniref:T7SS effector LXG polymorphic toxin n=1 Tax=Pseudalkalibacillus decolorationis TaxID=163879 RepID=UPI0021499330|nr:T7SS effector LXG polymorphic toxin [Pseudalkalibacillus decolorationis]
MNVNGSTTGARSTSVYEARTLLDTMATRKNEYEQLRDQLETLQTALKSIVNLDNEFQGKGADAIKGFFRIQAEVVGDWIQLANANIVFFGAMEMDAEEKKLSGDAIVEVPFLESDLFQSALRADQMVADQQQALQNIFSRISDIHQMDVFSRAGFDSQMEKAEKKRRDTIDAVNQLDEIWMGQYVPLQDTERVISEKFKLLMESSRQGNQISPIHFNSVAYQTSDVHEQIKQAENRTEQYLKFKEEQAKARERIKELEELENRPWYEKAWDGVKTFTGEFTGYYDYLRATEGVDPITGRKLTAAERATAGAMAAAGFIPVVGWAGRAFKGGKAIYKTAKGMNAAENALDAYKNSKAFSKLEKAELGLYGLVSANGFGEYFTGKDMFGNELTEEQRQAGLYQGVFGSVFAAAPFTPQVARGSKKVSQQTLEKAHQMANKSKASMQDFMYSVRGGMDSLIPPGMQPAMAGIGPRVPMNTMNSSSVKKVIESTISKFSVKGITSNKTYKRPSGYRKGVRDKVWENAKKSDGEVRDPLTKKVINKDEQWDMGHKPGYEFRKHQQSATERGISRKEFLDEHNNPDHYQPELPSSNRSHQGEDLTDDYFGD